MDIILPFIGLIVVCAFGCGVILFSGKSETSIMCGYALLSMGVILLINETLLFMGAEDSTDIFIGSIIVGMGFVVLLHNKVFP